MLNPAQRQAVETTQGPLRILAGAGTGKTHTLVARIGYLIEMLKVPPHKILALTFTNKAARELNERLVRLQFPGVHATTFHALAAKLLRRYWKSDFTILTPKQQEAALLALLSFKEQKEAKTILNDLELVEYRKPRSSLSPVRLEGLRQAYQRQLKEMRALDFGSLITQLLELWEEDEGALEKSRALYEYILVDEYQDVNPPQIQLVRKLAESHRNLCVVGDPDQTLYSWRGSEEKSLAEFPLLYSEAASVTLTENYRNPAAILKGAETLIGHNPERLPKALEAKALNTGQISLWKNETEMGQQGVVTHLLQHYLGGHGNMHETEGETDRAGQLLHFSDVALLCRTQAEAKRWAAELSKQGYPCQLSAPDHFWERKEIAEFIKHLEPLRFLESYPDELDFSHWLGQRIDAFLRQGEWKEDGVGRLHLLVSHALAYDDKPIQEALFEFLDEARTEQEADNLVEGGKLNIMTLHAAKGLEFPVVMILGLEEGNLPHQKKGEEGVESLPEERRLLYVGMTRPTQDLHLFFCNQKWGQPKTASRFLDEIGSDNMVPGTLPEAKAQTLKRKAIKKSQMKLF